MLVFNEKDKYETIEHSSGPSSVATVAEKSLATRTIKKRNTKKLSKTNIEFLKSLGFKLKQKQQ